MNFSGQEGGNDQEEVGKQIYSMKKIYITCKKEKN